MKYQEGALPGDLSLVSTNYLRNLAAAKFVLPTHALRDTPVTFVCVRETSNPGVLRSAVALRAVICLALPSSSTTQGRTADPRVR